MTETEQLTEIYGVEVAKRILDGRRIKASGIDPIEVDIQRPDGVHRVEIRYDSIGIIDAERVGFYVDGEEVDVNPTTFDLTASEEAYFADKFLTQLAEDAADRRAEERGEKWG